MGLQVYRPNSTVVPGTDAAAASTAPTAGFAAALAVLALAVSTLQL